MNRRLIAAAASITIAFVLAGIVQAQAAELKVFCAVALQPVLEELKPKFELTSGHKLAMVYEPLGLALKRLEGGETADITILPRQGIDRLVSGGKAAGNNVADVARSGMSVAVRKGAPKPDISSPESFKRAMLAAKSINVPDPARGGLGIQHVFKMFEQLGITQEMKAKFVYQKVPGLAGVAREVVNGEAEIALYHLQELATVAGIDIVGPFPGDLQVTTVFSAVIMGSATNVDVAKVLIAFLLRTPEAASAIRAKGLEPAL